MKIPLKQLEDLLERVKNKLITAHKEARDINQQEYVDLLVEKIKEETAIELKSSTLYKRILLPISKEEPLIDVNSKYKDAFIAYLGFKSFEEFEQVSPIPQTVSFEESSFFEAFTYEESGKIQRFRFAILSIKGKTQAQLQSIRNNYFGDLVEERPNNLFLDMYSTGEQSIKTNVILFIGSNKSIQQKASLLLGVFTQVNREGKPLASRAVFVRQENIKTFDQLPTPHVITEFDSEYKNIPIAIRRYLFSRKENIVKADNSQAFKISDLVAYEEKASIISPYAGYYKLFFTDTHEALSMNRMQILPVTGRVFYRSSQRNWLGHAEKRGGNLFIELIPFGTDEKAFITLFVGNEPTLRKSILYKGVFTSINGAYQPFAGRVVVVFEHKLSMDHSLLDEKDESKYPTKQVTKEELDIPEIWDYLVQEKDNQLDIGRVKYFDKRDLTS